jgi:hypothetical protein
MNAYVHAGLLTLGTSAWPRSGPLHVAEAELSPRFAAAVDRALDLLPRITGAQTPHEDRVDLTRRLFELYRELPESRPAEIPRLMRLLAALAFLPLVAERNDGFALWWHPPVRPIEPAHSQLMTLMHGPFSYEDAFRRFEPQATRRGANLERPVSLLYVITIMLVQSIIVMMENGVASEETLQAFRNAETAMRDFEARYGLAGLEDVPLGLKNPEQLRYRNTLYLYGGNLLERAGRHEEAVSWYLREIDDHVDLPRSLGFYMTAFKTCERLLSAYRIDRRHPRVKATLLALIHKALVRSFDQTRNYSEDTLATVDAHPNLDLSQPKLELGNRTVLYAGEASREPLLIALLYRKMVQDVPYRDTDYSLFVPG